MKLRTAVYAASLDPITFGHINVAERMAPHFDEFILIVAVDSRKNYTFSMNERVQMAKDAKRAEDQGGQAQQRRRDRRIGARGFVHRFKGLARLRSGEEPDLAEHAFAGDGLVEKPAGDRDRQDEERRNRDRRVESQRCAEARGVVIEKSPRRAPGDAGNPPAQAWRTRRGFAGSHEGRRAGAALLPCRVPAGRRRAEQGCGLQQARSPRWFLFVVFTGMVGEHLLQPAA